MASWSLDPSVTHLNHGSFGACPTEVLARQTRLRTEMETNPVDFMLRRYQPALEEARAALGDFVGADPAGLVFVPNATYGVNSVLRSMEPRLAPGSELVVTDHTYNACRNAVEVTARRTGSVVVVASIPFPITGPDEAYDAVMNVVTTDTAMVVLDHVTSPTALVLPIERLVADLEPDVPVLVDGAHGPGMVAVDIDALGASFYTANCHKWMCSPKGAAFLAVAERHRDTLAAVSVSHGHNGGWPGSGSGFHARFDWTGTDDPTARLCVSAAIETMGADRPGGWPGIRDANRSLVLDGRRIVAQSIGCAEPAPDEMVGSMAALPLPDPHEPADSIFDPLTEHLRSRWSIEVPVFTWPAAPHRLIRMSAQVYNTRSDYVLLAEALSTELARVPTS